MPTYRVEVTEKVTVPYPPFEVEAEHETEARRKAELCRVDGSLGDRNEHAIIEQVDVTVELLAEPKPLRLSRYEGMQLRRMLAEYRGKSDDSGRIALCTKLERLLEGCGP